MKRGFKILLAALMLIGIIGLIGLASQKFKPESARLNIVVSSFPSYDFLRALTQGDSSIQVTMLLKPGAEMHSFEPSPQDIKTIQGSDMFVYVGGESDEWIDDIVSNLNTNKTKVVKLIDLVETVKEEHITGMEDEHSDEAETEADEHVWTSPVNAIKIIQKLKDALIEIDQAKKSFYEQNADTYVQELSKINAEIRDLVNSAKRKEIIVGDRFPLRYFVDEYGLSYYAAFPGCSEQTEASAKTIAFLVSKVKEDSIPVVIYMELSDGKIAEAIARETGAKTFKFQSAHNVSQEDFERGVTYADIMRENIKVLKEALN